MFTLQFVLKILPCLAGAVPPEPELHQNFYPHKNDAAP
jgi:hypothetical protein